MEINNHSLLSPLRRSPAYFKSSSSVIARNFFLNFLGYIVYLLTNFFFVQIMVRNFGTERFGIFSLGWVILGYFGILDLGLGKATTKFVAEASEKNETDKIPSFIWNAILTQGVLGALGTIILMLFTPFLVERVFNIPVIYINEAKSIFYLLSLAIPITIISFTLRGVIEARQRFDLINYVNIPFMAVNFVLPVLGIFFGFGLKDVIAILVGLRAVLLLLWGSLCFRFLFDGKRKFIQKETIYYLFSFGGWMSLFIILIPTFYTLDRFIIGIFLNLAAVSYYSAPYEAVSRLWGIPFSLVSTLFPAFSALTGKKAYAEIEVLFVRSIKLFIILIGLLIIPLFFLAQDVMQFWLGPDFVRNSTSVFRILLIGFVSNCFSSVPIFFMLGSGRPDIVAKLNLLEAVFYVPLLFLLTKWHGINGAAAACAARFTADMLLFYFVIWKVNGINILALSKKVLLKASAVLLISVFAGVLIARSPWRVYNFSLLLVATFLLNWLYVLDANERGWLIKQALFFKK